ncbi:MAG: PAS domain-containing protein [Bacteroidota bacterium]
MELTIESKNGVHKSKKHARPTPNTQESPFLFEEVFFSVTNPKSTITYANEVFIRVSKYEKEEIIGQPHNCIRHPDMPRCVFEIFWDFLKAGKPVAAYVKNLAKDGSYYWVMALAFPCKSGYLSIRIKPGSPVFKGIQQLYADLVAMEKRLEPEEGKKGAMHSARKCLLDYLAQEGYSTYDEFMWSSLQKEIHYRDNELVKRGLGNRRFESEGVPSYLTSLKPVLTHMFSSLTELKEINKTISEHYDYIINLSRTIKLLALNALVGSSKLSSEDQSISVVAENMGLQSNAGEVQLLEMKNQIEDLTDLLNELSFGIISSNLQVETAIDFLTEQDVSDRVSGEKEKEEVIQILHDSYTPSLVSIANQIEEVPRYLQKLTKGVRDVEQFLLTLRVIYVAGKVEIARMDNAEHSFSKTFEDLVQELVRAESNLEEFTRIIDTNRNIGNRYSSYKFKLDGLIKEIGR